MSNYSSHRAILEDHINACRRAQNVARRAYRTAIADYLTEAGKQASKLQTTLKAEFSKRAHTELTEFHEACRDARLHAATVSDDINTCHACLPAWIWQGDVWGGD